MTTSQPCSPDQHLSSVVGAALNDVAQAIVTVSSRVTGPAKPLSPELYDRLTGDVLGLINMAESMCHLAAQAAVCESNDEEDLRRLLYLEQAAVLVSMRTKVRSLLLQSRPHIEVDPRLSQLLSQLSRPHPQQKLDRDRS